MSTSLSMGEGDRKERPNSKEGARVAGAASLEEPMILIGGLESNVECVGKSSKEWTAATEERRRMSEERCVSI